MGNGKTTIEITPKTTDQLYNTALGSEMRLHIQCIRHWYPNRNFDQISSHFVIAFAFAFEYRLTIHINCFIDKLQEVSVSMWWTRNPKFVFDFYIFPSFNQNIIVSEAGNGQNKYLSIHFILFSFLVKIAQLISFDLIQSM